MSLLAASACYWWSSVNPYALLAVLPCLALNWFGDSLDGTLARAAKVQELLGVGSIALVDRYGGRTMSRLKGFVGKNAFYASFMIRNVPSAPRPGGRQQA